MRVLGLDPGLRKTGWGIIDVMGASHKFVASGIIKPPTDALMADRLQALDAALSDVIQAYTPETAAVEEVFVNENPRSALKLGMARGVVLLAPAKFELYVAEYTPNVIKKSVVGKGHADKNQVATMVKFILPKCELQGEDDADALAVAICHAHHMATERKLQQLS